MYVRMQGVNELTLHCRGCSEQHSEAAVPPQAGEGAQHSDVAALRGEWPRVLSGAGVPHRIQVHAALRSQSLPVGLLL